MNKINLTLLIFFVAPQVVATQLQAEIRAQGGTGYRINDMRQFEADENTVYKEDGAVIPEIRAQGGTGYKIRYKATDANPQFTSGTLEEINLINVYKGPVISLSPFKVFDIDSLLTNETFYANDLNLADLELGDTVSVSGFVDNASASVITRIELNNALSEWKVSGYVEALTAGQFKINNQLINYSATVITDCDGPLSQGDFVEVFATPVSDFALNEPLDSVTEINCVSRAVLPTGTDDYVIIEGMIDAVAEDGNFVIAGQEVLVDHRTRYIRGRAVDVQERVKLEVEGSVDTPTGTLTADKIRFLGPRINITLPVVPDDYTDNQFNIAGVALKVTPQTLDPEGVLSNGILKPMQLQFRGYDNEAGDLFITRLYTRGTVDFDDVSLNGYLTELNDPFIGVFGVTLDTSNAGFIDINDDPISAVEFFASVNIGSELEVQNATLDQFTNSLAGGTIQILNIANAKSDEINNVVNKPGSNNVVGVGTLTSQAEMVFEATFEAPE